MKSKQFTAVMAAGIVFFALWSVGQSHEPKPKPASQPATQPENAYGQYYVIYKDPATFTPEVRKKLGVIGPHMDGWRGRKDCIDTKGYMAWLTSAQAGTVADDDRVVAVHKVGPENVLVHGNKVPGLQKLMVSIAPNCWSERPDAKTYLSTAKIVEFWTKQLQKYGKVTIRQAGEQLIIIDFGKGKIPDKAIDQLKSHPQTNYMEWDSPVGI